MSAGYSGVVMRFQNGLVVGKGGGVRPPSSYKVSTGDVDVDDKRSMSGYLNRNRVRGGSTAVYTVEVSWTRLTWDELVKLIAAGESSYFNLTFLDPKSKGGTTTKKMYRDANMSYELVNIFSEEEAYWTTTMAFVEF